MALLLGRSTLGRLPSELQARLFLESAVTTICNVLHFDHSVLRLGKEPHMYESVHAGLSYLALSVLRNNEGFSSATPKQTRPGT